ncbi:MAG: iron-sulfur cluster assembly scaffold protein [Alphaproteobacteria bacterium]|nr:MAG: iron-sulfur cluster assembly scaffold protein [Alphaproteobacteria bacterium]
MVEEIYQKPLLRLAGAATGAGSLPNPDAEETLDNPTCGDRITVQLTFTDGKITDLRHETRACMLCQAAASVLGEEAAGHSLEELCETRDDLAAFLKNEKEKAPAGWEKLDLFSVVAEHKSRHLCVLLPFDATINALEMKNKKS